MRDGEQVAAVLVREEVEEVVEAAPRDARETQAARLVRGQEHAVPRVRAPRRRRTLARRRVREGRLREELLDAVNLAVEKRRGDLVVRRHRLRDQFRFGEDRGAEELVARRHAGGGQGDNLVLDGGEESFEESDRVGIIGLGCHLVDNDGARSGLDVEIRGGGRLSYQSRNAGWRNMHLL